MAKVKLNPILEQLQGKVGDLVFKRYGDEVIISRKPDLSGHEFSEAQIAAQERFRQAALYGKMVMADPETKAVYEKEAEMTGKPVFSLTVADFFNAPTIDEVDLAAYGGAIGDEIIIRASDDFEVVSVQVAITDTDSNLIESGQAVETPANSGRWVYQATSEVAAGNSIRIAVRASDRPGGEGSSESEVEL